MKVFVASAMPTAYPWKLQKPATVTPKVRDTAEQFILDSGIGDNVSTGELLQLAERHEPEYIVAKDELYDHTTSTENTLDLLDGLTSCKASSTPLLPLQPPYDEHYDLLSDHGLDDRMYVLGGMATEDVDTDTQLRWIRNFRRVAPDVYAHGLGVGGGIEFVTRVAGSGLLDSVDCSTPELAAMNGAVIDDRLRQTPTMSFPGGKGRNRRTYPLAEFNSWQIHDVWARESDPTHVRGDDDQSGLEAFADADE